MLKILVICCLLPAMLVFGVSQPATASQGKVYTVAVIPSAPPMTLHKQWAPFMERLTHDTGLEFRLKMYEMMAEFERDIWSGAPDFIFSSPIQTVVAHKTNGYVPLVRSGKEIAIGLFVRKDSPITNIDDLTGQSISFVGNKSLCSVFIQHLLGQNRNKLSFSREYAGSTRNVIINVLLGKSVAGAVFIPELARESEDTRKQLREILVTAGIAPHPLSANPRVPTTAQEAVKKATLAMATTKDGAELLTTLRMEAPITANYERDYRSLEEIDIKGLTNWGTVMLYLPRRLNARIILIVSCILLATGVASGWLTARRQTDIHLRAMRKDAAIMVRNFAESCARYLLVQNYAELESFLLKSAELTNIRRLRVCEPDGALVWDVELNIDGQPHAKTGITRLTPPLAQTEVVTTENDRLVIWQPIVAGNMLGWLKADFSLADSHQTQGAIWKDSLLLAMVWVACSAVLIILLLRPIVQSIGKLTAFAMQLDEHKGAQISVTGQPLEIAELGASLNEASTRLLATERQLLKERELLRKGEENYRRLLDTVQEGIWVIDSASITTFVNPRMADILGYKPEEIVGKPLYSFMDEQWKLLADSNNNQRNQDIREQHDLEFIRKDGERIYTRLETAPILDENGQHSGSIAAVADITARKRTEDELHNLNEELEQRVKLRTTELEEKNCELERMNRIFVGRELRMVELKERIRELALKSSG